MPIVPIQAAAAMLAAGPVAEAALSAASATFAGLLQAVKLTPPDAPHGSTSSGSPQTFPLPNQLVTAPPGLPVTPNLAELRHQTATLLKQFHQLLGRLLAENEIDPADGFRLQFGSIGQVRVVGTHPEKFGVESLIAEHPELAELLQTIAANSKLLQAVDEAVEFQRRSAASPQTASAQFPHLFSGDRSSHNRNQFSLFFDRQQATVSFDARGA